jgi:tetratricopeptide (TPR) repeat protein
LELFTQHPDLLPSGLATVARDEVAFSRTVDELVARNLVHHGTDGLTVHPLLAAAVGRRMSIKQRQEAAKTVRDLLAEHLRGDDEEAVRTPRNVSVWRALMPHLLSVTNDIDRHGEDRDHAAFLFAGAGNYLRAQDEAAARPLLESALRIDERSRPDGDPVIARRLNSLASLLKAGRPDQALPLLDRALHIDEAALGPNDRRVADDLEALAGVLGDLGRTADADRLRQRAKRIR